MKSLEHLRKLERWVLEDLLGLSLEGKPFQDYYALKRLRRTLLRSPQVILHSQSSANSMTPILGSGMKQVFGDFLESNSEPSSQKDDFDIESEDDAEPPGDEMAGWSSSKSGGNSNDDGPRSLGDFGSTDSADESQQMVSSFGGLSSSTTSTDAAERLRTHELLTSSGNAWHYQEAIHSHRSKICDVCGLLAQHWLHCFICGHSDYDVCLDCIHKGRWCLDGSHELLEANDSGPLRMRRCSEWVVGNEIRVYDMPSDGPQKCVLEFSTQEEKLLHESPPAIHPSSPIVAWPLSPTKLLLASFGGDSERIITPMKPYARSGRRIYIEVQFSRCGLYLFVTSIEAAKVKGKDRGLTYSLHMHVAALQLRFHGQTMMRPVPDHERYYDLGTMVPAILEILPFSWTCTRHGIYLTLGLSSSVKLYRVKIHVLGDRRPFFQPIERASALLSPERDRGPFRAPYISTSKIDVPRVILIPLNMSEGPGLPSIRFLEADTPWSTFDGEHGTSHADLQAAPKGQSASSRTRMIREESENKWSDRSNHLYPVELNQVHSEIRLLYLLPAVGDEEICCSLIKVSLDDHEMAKSRLTETLSDAEGWNKETRYNNKTPRAESRRDLPPPLASDPNFQPRVLARVDYSKPENSNTTKMDLLGKAIMETKTLQKGLRSIADEALTGTPAALAAFILGKKQRNVRRKKLLHPNYNYEALSYVWGKSEYNRTITLDGKRNVPVTDNLYAALRRLRYQHRQRVLWVDAVCIDQQNLEERNLQVQMMGRIYNAAANVVVWLGDTDDTEPRLDSATPFHRGNAEENLYKEEDGGEIKAHSRSDSVSEWQTKILAEVLEFASPPWWTRAWVTQELVLAEDVNVAFEPVEMDWATFEAKMWKTWKTYGKLERLIYLRETRREWYYRGSIGETALLARNTAATNSRDRVYSLLGLVRPEQAARVKPDYGLKPEEVFVQATLADLWDNVYGSHVYEESPESLGVGVKAARYQNVPRYPVTKTLSEGIVQTGLRPDRFRILNWAKPNSLRRISGMPSWAVDFSDPTSFTSDAEFRLGYSRWTFDGNGDLNQRASLKVSSDNRMLTVRGLVFDHIEDIITDTPVREYRDGFEGDTGFISSKLLNMFSSLPAESPYKLLTGPGAVLRKDDLRVVKRRNWIITETKPGHVVIGYEKIITQVLPHWNPETERGQIDWTGLHSFGLALGRGDSSGCQVAGCRCDASRLFRAWDECVSVPDHARNFAHEELKQRSPWEEYCRTLEGGPEREFVDPLHEEQTRFLLTTSRGFLGLGPESVRAGDLIALFFGSDIPVLLRPNGDYHVYLGRAWINGIMQGELWNIYEDPMLEERDFVMC